MESLGDEKEGRTTLTIVRITPYNVLYGKAPPERATFFKIQVYRRVGISLVKVYIYKVYIFPSDGRD